MYVFTIVVTKNDIPDKLVHYLMRDIMPASAYSDKIQKKIDEILEEYGIPTTGEEYERAMWYNGGGISIQNLYITFFIEYADDPEDMDTQCTQEPRSSPEKISIEDSCDVNIIDSTVAIDTKGNVYYIAPLFECGISMPEHGDPVHSIKPLNDASNSRCKYYDPVYKIRDIKEWEITFANMTPQEIASIEKSCGHEWTGKVTANNIDDYISYYGIDEITYEYAMCNYGEFSKMLDVMDEYNTPIPPPSISISE